MRPPALFPAATLIVVLASCGSSSLRSAGTSCSTDSDCAAGLSCLGLATAGADGGCTVSANACTKTCATDSDCTSVGPKFKCFASCNGGGTCGQTP